MTGGRMGTAPQWLLTTKLVRSKELRQYHENPVSASPVWGITNQSSFRILECQNKHIHWPTEMDSKLENYPSVTLTRGYLPLRLKQLVKYCWLYVPCWIFLVSYYWFYIPRFIFQVWESFGSLGLASRPRLGLLYIPGCIFLSLYSLFHIPGLLVYYSWFSIPWSIFLVEYSWLQNC